ncbi:putative Mg2+ transporter-C (MgtC) family protein [Geosporobacter subterraneus DSM 17957]|uniref:Putative Mg2+ transporter-C (MgtC) family protein n=1 Tax=Geosporobacter subterraneus DSM 17957 TaxID=1121919 RepID=A0A1M6PPP6_9FIRM|nr:MgtC/SapB family protein [Geosporobacter subterraneus]SHK09808.1 putative Mg2+ transporter-C (MgtC) family protein [Geosporobacter subterraneus DSM 17957]
MLSLTDIMMRLGLSCLLGGLIGMERESINRPAGFRTHILVCIGSTLIMLSGIFLFYEFIDYTNMDPARLGAQVVSGIGFLGAGTIIRDGSSVKGLTTAASLWAVAGIGIATGAGFYIGAIAATGFILMILIIFSKFERYLNKKNNGAIIRVTIINRPGQLGKITTELGNHNVSITNISMNPADEQHVIVELTLILPRRLSKVDLMDHLSELDTVQSVEILH